jgi:putative transposase
MMAQRTRKPYPTDLSDAEWRIIEPLLPRPSTRRGRPRVHSYREILNAIFYVLRTGGAWRMLPHDFPPLANGLSRFSAVAAGWHLATDS